MDQRLDPPAQSQSRYKDAQQQAQEKIPGEQQPGSPSNKQDQSGGQKSAEHEREDQKRR